MTHRRIPPRVSGQFAKLVVRGTLIQNARRFKGNPIFRKVVDQALKDDSTFADEVERLKKRKDTSGGNFWDNQD